MSTAISTAQIRAIHTLKGKAGLDDDAYRDLLGQFGVSSSKALGSDGAIRVIDRLRVLSGDVRGSRETTSKPAGALDLSGSYAGICRALWISAWNLGLVEHREDTALVAFVKRQTGIEHLNWVRDPEDSRKVIEALKGWLAREAGVQWAKVAKLDTRTQADRVIEAQLRLLAGEGGNAGALVGLWKAGRASPADRVALMKALGFDIRRRAHR